MDGNSQAVLSNDEGVSSQENWPIRDVGMPIVQCYGESCVRHELVGAQGARNVRVMATRCDVMAGRGRRADLRVFVVAWSALCWSVSWCFLVPETDSVW